jgi:iron complex outermembrane recepter protein
MLEAGDGKEAGAEPETEASASWVPLYFLPSTFGSFLVLCVPFRRHCPHEQKEAGAGGVGWWKLIAFMSLFGGWSWRGRWHNRCSRQFVLVPMQLTSFVPRSWSISAALVATSASALAQATESVTEMERFIAEESALAASGHLFPTSRTVPSVFGDLPLLEVPRSVTVLTPELMRQFDIQDFSDLSRIGAGTQQINYYGVPGTPILRGAKGGVFFNGIQRAYQRNEMPLSFGSLEAMDLVKGPAPAHFGPSQAGGYVHLIPKSPFFDRTRGAITLEAGQHDHYRVQLDHGGPFWLGGRPSAYRVSITGQAADSYYDRVGNDFVSVYGAVKSRLADGVSLFTGGEFFRFRSNENAGWNRPTQALIDRGEYIIGEPVSITSPAWGGNAVRTLIEFPFTYHLAPPFSSPLMALAVPGDVARERIPAGLRAHMIDMNDPANVARVYRALPQPNVPGFASPALQPVTVAALNQVTQTTQDVFIYTPAYFAAGGEALTAPIKGSTVLSDRDDYANSTNFLGFIDLEVARAPDRTFKLQSLFDIIRTNKLSTYGYAIETEQFVFELKGTATERRPWFAGTVLHYGISARHTDAKLLQDFFGEPFSRRDITRATISPNTVILSGGQRGPNGQNFWSPTSQGGANAHSKLWQFSAFGYAETRLTPRLTTYTSAILAHAPYRTRYPEEVDRVPADDPRRTPVSEHKDYGSFSFSPIYKLTSEVSLYGTYQIGTSLDPIMGGAIVGRGNFADNELLELGSKVSLFADRLFASVAGYRWKQSSFDERSNTAEPLEGRGIEMELSAAPSPRLTLIASANHQRVRRNSPLVFRAPAYTAEQWALYGGVLAFENAPSRPAANPTLIYPGTPETQVKLFAIYSFDNGFGLSGGPIWSDAYWHNFDRTIRLPATLVWHGSVFYRRPRWDVTLTLQNLTNEDYFIGAEPVFAANTIITKAPEFEGKLSVTVRF